MHGAWIDEYPFDSYTSRIYAADAFPIGVAIAAAEAPIKLVFYFVAIKFIVGA
jgi:hypothetical protein